MPIYEYRCADCKRKVSIFFSSFSVADRRAADGEIECPRCSSKNLSRLMSKANMIRGGTRADESAFDEMEDRGMGGMGGMGGMDEMGGFGGMFDGIDTEDPRTVARQVRMMKDSLGAEADLGPEFDRALSRIEAGEDPDKVMEDMDPESLDMGGGGDDSDFGDDD